MKPEYVPSNSGNPHSRYIIGAQNGEEQKLMTILRDLALREDKNVVLVIDGAEWVDKKIPGMPPNPVTRLSFHLEYRNGSPFVPKPGQNVDPSKYVSEHSTGTLHRLKEAENVRVQEAGGKTTVEIK